MYPREAKSLPISDAARAVLALDVEAPTPDDVVSAVLRAPVDLLWNGGIGTFVKASTETDADVGDRANDAVRIDATELRSRVIAEGGNLGLTQRARVEYALAGGRVNTDAIDNSAGVDCSDHEVNIKILLRAAIGVGRLTDAERDPLLESMTDEVAALVLADNEAQTNALAIAAVEAPGLVGVHARQMERLEHTGLLDRALERLPDAKGLQERHASRSRLTAPELAVLLAFTKLDLQRELVASDVPDDPYLRPDLHDYFPVALRERFGDLIEAHPLHREITATVVANAVVNRAGISFLSRLADETGTSLPVLARAHIAARDVFDIGNTWSAIDDLDLLVPAATQDRMFLAARRLVERGARWLVRRSVQPRPRADGQPVPRTGGGCRRPVARARDRSRRRHDRGRGGTPARRRSAGRARAPSCRVPDRDRRARDCRRRGGARRRRRRGGGLFFTVADRLRLDWLRDRVAALPACRSLADRGSRRAA